MTGADKAAAKKNRVGMSDRPRPIRRVDELAMDVRIATHRHLTLNKENTDEIPELRPPLREVPGNATPARAHASDG
jgi:hypothetical protein